MSSAVDLKTKEEKDAELDRRIEALRKKNEALVKRYQEIEEDKKKAEQEGIAVTTPRKPRPHEPETDRRKTEKENFTVTVDLSKLTGDKRVVNDWKPGTPRGRKTSEESDGHREGHNDGGHRGGPNDGGPEGVPTMAATEGVPTMAATGGPNDGGHRGGPNDGGPRGGPTMAAPEGGPTMAATVGGRLTVPEGVRTMAGTEGGPTMAATQEGPTMATGGGAEEEEGGGGGEGTPGGNDRKSKEWEEKRRQNIEKMNEEMEKIAEYERGQRPDVDKPIRNFLDDPRRSGPAPDIDRKEGSRRHVRNWGGLDFDNVKTRAELEKEWTSRRPGPKGSMDMTMSMTGRERAEYVRWKKEREQIDEERLARHRNATGQWRREWDAQKTENMFKEDPYVASEGNTPEQGNRRDDSKRPPKVPTFGEFLSQGRSPGQRGDRGDRGRGRGRGQKPSYSMHDNRWEGDKEEEEKEDKMKREKKKEKDEEKSKPPAAQKAEPKHGDGEDDDEEEWEDASDGEDDEGSDLEHDSRGDEKKDTGKEKRAKSKDNSPTSPPPRSRPTSAGSPKDQRPPRPKVHIPPPAAVQESPEGGKPLSPFFPLESHQPVSDWGEEMEMLSPRSSMGGESPLKPPSVESSPPQKKEQEETEETEETMESQVVSGNEPAEPQKEEDTAIDDDSSPKTKAQQTVIVSEPESLPTDSPAAPPSDPAPSEVSCPAPSEVNEAAVAVDQDTPAAPSQEDELDAPPSPAALEVDDESSEPAGGKDDDTTAAGADTAQTAEENESSEPTSSEELNGQSAVTNAARVTVRTLPLGCSLQKC
ncbi:coiled-coil domain-containing protein 9 [Anoplopoma fimbria]|uniref:coiled-coil domain-containing protein 9 n=1 Tax=Anoplopoma fimbria TaxID=229290 RepID=UPI0023ED648C|nr:coiled-coil domain-containing protein 9 [Anoplopoma fimbria]